MNRSALEATSKGECMESKGVPQSMISMPYTARYLAMVPPPPSSTLPNWPACQTTPCSLKMRRIQATYSALASLVEYLPPLPPYLWKQTP